MERLKREPYHVPPHRPRYADPNLILWLPLWTAGVKDYSRFGNNGTLIGCKNWVHHNLFGPALDFCDAGDYIDCGADSSLNWGAGDGTVIVWFERDDSADVGALIIKGKRYAGGKRYLMYIDGSGQIVFNIDDNVASPSVTSTTVGLDDGTWHQAAGVRDGNNLRLYIDGVEDKAPTDIAGILTLDDAGVCTIGASNDAGGDPGTEQLFEGVIAEVRVYNRAMTAVEIQKIYRGEI